MKCLRGFALWGQNPVLCRSACRVVASLPQAKPLGTFQGVAISMLCGVVQVSMVVAHSMHAVGI